eukprot:6555038-Pyramimonas_sp.AAC.1
MNKNLSLVNKISTGGVSLLSASEGPDKASGPLDNDSGRNTGPGDWVETFGGRRDEQTKTSAPSSQ